MASDLDFRALRFRSIQERAHKVDVGALGKPTPQGCSFRDWLESLPNFLAVQELGAVAHAVVAARKAGKPVVLAFGGHVVKTGCGPLVIDMMERGIVTAVATNGSGAIHDLELAQTGATSEEVADTIRDGSFGMVSETCQWMNEAAALGAKSGLGAGVGAVIEKSEAPHRRHSIFAAAFRKSVPATVHVAVGTDTVHVHPDADGAAIGAATLRDFRTLCGLVAAMGSKIGESVGGVWLNFGSAVIMPEVFLKAVSVARNLGHDLSHVQTGNFDMIKHYRPVQNVVTRPVLPGRGHHVTGHHELTLPLLRQAILEYGA
jgi:hypothetical protein